MKLDHRRTILVGLAFLSICSFWQMYDSVIPKILTETFRLNETISGAIMALDNILALFLLPLFGALSDRTSTKIGRRMPFILLGTACAAVLMNLLPVLDNRYAAAPSTGKLVGFATVLGLLLVAMGTYRSPAVALMPDVTPNPLRSRANAIINLMGAIGGIIYLAVAAVMYPNTKIAGLAHVNYQPLFLVVSAVMLVSVAVLFLTVKEPRLAAETRALEAQHPEWDLTEDDGSGNEVLPKPVKRSLVFLLVSIALWYIGYNGVTTWWSTYVGAVMGQGLGGALLAAMFLTFYFLTTLYSTIHPVMFVCFALVGFAWAAINVNSLPMVLEMCRGSDIGKFTGYYYTFSMAAQVVTPVLAGTLMRHISYRVLFPYAALFVGASFVTMCFVRHGDSRAEAKSGLAAFEDMDD